MSPTPAHADTELDHALSQEIRRIGLAEVRHGRAFIWLLGRLFADQPQLSMSDVTVRLAGAMLGSGNDEVWQQRQVSAAPTPGGGYQRG